MSKSTKTYNKLKIQEAIQGYLFLTPWLIGLLVFTVYPILASIFYSFTKYNIFNPPQWAGLKNYITIFTDDKNFTRSLVLTFRYVIISIPIKMVSALLVAVLLNQKIRGIGIYRTIYYLPYLLGGSVAMSVTWKMVLSRTGFVNQFFSLFNLGPFNFLSSPKTALATLAMITAWQFGSSMLIFLAGLKGIPNELYEAAKIDGARKHQQFFRVTLPLLGPTFVFNLIMGIIGSYQVFSLSYVTTNGGPVKSTYFYMLYLYETAFGQMRMGYASALAWILTVIIAVSTAIAYAFSNRFAYYES